MAYRLWQPVGEPRAVVQLVHGMAEHIDRYDRMARALTAQGYVVAGRNHRGHGPEAETLGYFADKDGWNALVEDAHDLSLALRGADRVGVFREGRLLCCDTPEAVYQSGILAPVFDVNVHRADTPHGPQYYCTVKEE